MNNIRFDPSFNILQHTAARLILAVALALMVASATPARAADQRAVLTRSAPVYPEIARRMKISGVVRLEVTVDASGKVTDVKTLSGNHMLSSAAEDAVRKWKFEPGPGVSTVEESLNFALAQ
jgi:TonB family protein